jgi:hypothetical protein
MRYTVVYTPAALKKLAQIWLLSANPQAVTDASNQIDQVLGQAADRSGIPVGPYRLLRVDPLEVMYEVSDADCLVTVFQVDEVI